MKHVMVDLETLDTTETSIILSIGAVLFDVDKIESTFYVTLFPEQQAQEYKRTISPETVIWWIKQSKEAQTAAFLSGGRVHLETALEKFHEWYGNDPKRPIWSKPAHFDISVLGHAYRQIGMTTLPWLHTSVRCMRTLMKLLPNVKPDAAPTVAHNALDDAVAQALHVQLLLERLGDIQ